MTTNPGTSANIASALVEMAARHPDMLAVAVPLRRQSGGAYQYREWTYAQLNRESDVVARGLLSGAFEPGMRVVLMVTPSLEFFALTFALFKAGLIPVVVDPGMGVANLSQCLGEAEPEGFIGITKAHVARVLFGWARKTITRQVTVGAKLGWGGETLKQVRMRGLQGQDFHCKEAATDETAAILFTSGSTGVPKGAVYSHGNFTAQVETIRETYGIEPGERDLCTFPLFALFAPALGMSAVIPDMDGSKPATADPDRIIQSIMDYEVTNLFGSPALLRVLGRHVKARGTQLPSLRRIISAGAPMTADILEAVTPALQEGAHVWPGYGATEAMPLCTLDSGTYLRETREQTDRGAGVCVGSPVVNAEIAIIGISDDPISSWSDDLAVPSGTVGEIVAKGPMVTRSYHQREEATALAKIADGDVVRHRMGDLGYRDDQGRIWFCGRKAHRVPTADGDLFTIPVECIFNTHPNIFRTALVGVGPDAMKEPVLCVELHDGDPAKPDHPRWKPFKPDILDPSTPALEGPNLSTLRAEILEIGEAHASCRLIQRVLFPPRFPVDVRHNSKIFREKLALWAEQQLNGRIQR